MKRKWISRLTALGCAAALSFGALGCGSTSSDSASGTSSADSAAGASSTGSAGEAASSSGSTTGEEGNPVYGGTLNVAVGSVTSLDGQFESADEPMTRHIFEPVLELDGDYAVQTGVCSYEVSDDYLTITLTVRDGVTFHNGDPVEANDIKASLERWIANSSNGSDYVGNYLKDIEVTGDRTLELHFQSVASAALSAMAYNYLGSFVMPAEICEKYPDSPVSDTADLIGTGPYKFDEWVPDNYIHVVRYDGYVGSGNDCSGAAGNKNAYVDDIYFYFSTDSDAEVNGVLSGTYDLAEQVNYSIYMSQQENPDVKFELIADGVRPSMVMDKSEGWTANKTFRQAVLACIDSEAALKASFGTEDLYVLDGSWYYDEMPTDASLYNQADTEKAKELLEECGYDGSELIYITQESGYYYNTAYMACESMKAAGINVTLKVMDQAELYTLRKDPSQYDFFAVGFSMKADPTMIAFLSDSWPGLWVNDKKTELLEAMAATLDLDEKKDLWQDMTDLIYDEVPVVLFGSKKNCTMVTQRTMNATYEGGEPYYWNIWIEE